MCEAIQVNSGKSRQDRTRTAYVHVISSIFLFFRPIFINDQRRFIKVKYYLKKDGHASTVLDPHTQKNIHKLDMIQRRAARYACNRWHNISSVAEMVSHLGWEPLSTRRRNMRLCSHSTVM